MPQQLEGLSPERKKRKKTEIKFLNTLKREGRFVTQDFLESTLNNNTGIQDNQNM